MPSKFIQRGDLIGHAFSDPALLKQALTHRSAGAPHNERLEFLGDSIVNMMAAEALYRRWPKADEGAMTRARAELVREGALAVIGRSTELGERLTLGPGEMKSGGHRRDSIPPMRWKPWWLRSTGCRLRGLPGSGAAWFSASIEALPASGRPEKDPKTRLQEWLQARQKALPQYELVSESGDDHAKHFRVRCNVADPAASTEGEGASRRLAEQQAAAAVLEQLDSK